MVWICKGRLLHAEVERSHVVLREGANTVQSSTVRVYVTWASVRTAGSVMGSH